MSLPTQEHIKNVFTQIFGTLLSPLTVSLWASLILVTWAAGPFGTYIAMAPLMRLGFWTAVVTISILGDYLIRAITMLFVRPQNKLKFEMIAVALAILTFGPFVWCVGAFIADLNENPAPSLFVAVYYVVLVSVVLVLLRRLTPEFRRQSQLDDRHPGKIELPEPRLMQRLPEELRGQILRLSADGHFVEVVTEHGSHRLRMRFIDAIGETEPQEGYCAHRSHWVTRVAIEEVLRPSPHKILIRLTNGDEIPVGRKYKPDLEEAGIL